MRSKLQRASLREVLSWCPPEVRLEFSERLTGQPLRSVKEQCLGPVKTPLAVAGSLQERIAHPLAADGARLAVAADEGDVVAQRQELVLDRADQGRVVAARQVAAADRARKQHVADDGEAL